MKVFISVDMEGIAGVAVWKQVNPAEPDYRHARLWMAGEANAAVEGALAAGATEVTVNDSHGPMTNLLFDRMHPSARLISGNLKFQGMVAGLDDSFDAAMFVGYHTRAGQFGTLSHTWSGTPLRVTYNDTELGEIGINASVAGYYGVPVVMVTGDHLVAEEARALLGAGVETVVVKRALGRQASDSLSHPEACRLIREGATRALQQLGSVRPYEPGRPVRLTVSFSAPDQADSAAMAPRAERVDPLTVAYTAADALEAWRAFRMLVALTRL